MYETEEYHTKLYTENKLFEQGSWLEKPDPCVLNIVEKIKTRENIRVLDLGAGVGRLSIPIAKIISPKNGRVICVDYLDIAIKNLLKNAEIYGVSPFIDGVVIDIGRYEIKDNFDFMLAYSVLCHLESKEKVIEVLSNMIKHTKEDGYHYLYIITDFRKIDKDTGEAANSYIETYFTNIELRELLKEIYQEWEIIKLSNHPYAEDHTKEGQNLVWLFNYVKFIAKKRGSFSV